MGGSIFMELVTIVTLCSCFYSYRPRRGRDCIPK